LDIGGSGLATALAILLGSPAAAAANGDKYAKQYRGSS